MAQRKRRTQAERSAATRNLLRDAAVKCLFEHGYGATTTIMVAAEAGVSRGAMLHQFPSKADLMTYIVETDVEEEVALYTKLLEGINEPRERLIAYPMATWQVLSRPSGIAVLEILQGSRSDAALREKLAPVMARIEGRALKLLEKEFARGPSVPLFQLIVGTARGLSVEKFVGPGPDVVAAIELFQRLLEAGIEQGVLRGGDKAKSRDTKPRRTPDKPKPLGSRAAKID